MKTSKDSEHIISDLLVKMSPTLDKMVQRIKSDYEASHEQLFTKYDEIYTRLFLEKDIVKSFSSYAQASDKLESFQLHGSISGQLKISARITRGDITYTHLTDVIYAGGHNIQKLHYRYLTKSELPKTGDKTILDKFTAAISRLTKVEAISNDILRYKKQIDKMNIDIENKLKMSDEDILNKSESYITLSKITWDVIIERGCDKNYDYNQDNFIKSQDDYRTNCINHHKTMINSNQKSVKSISILIQKLESKRDAILED